MFKVDGVYLLVGFLFGAAVVFVVPIALQGQMAVGQVGSTSFVPNDGPLLKF